MNQLEICDCIAFWSNFHTKCIISSLFHEKLYVLEFLILTLGWSSGGAPGYITLRESGLWNQVWIFGNPFTLFHVTFRFFNRLEIRDRIAFWSDLYAKCIALHSSHKKSRALGLQLKVKIWWLSYWSWNSVSFLCTYSSSYLQSSS